MKKIQAREVEGEAQDSCNVRVIRRQWGKFLVADTNSWLTKTVKVLFFF